MAGQPCANHPNEITFVRCGKCDKPICVRCMVDSPVGKKCRPCARNQTHLSTSSGRQVAQAFLAALVVAVPAGWLAQQISLIILAFPYGWLVGEAAFRAGQRSRSLAVQVVTGLAALAGALAGSALPRPATFEELGAGFVAVVLMNPWTWVFAVLGVAAAVSKVRYL